MKKFRSQTVINLPRSNKTKSAIYEYEEKYYIFDSIGKSANPVKINNKIYCEVKCIDINSENEYWYTK